MKLFVILFLIAIALPVQKLVAQANTWDIPTTEALISHNKQNYSDHQVARNNQVVSQGTVSLWKSTTNKLNQLTSAIDQRLTSFYIITADAGIVINIYNKFSDMETAEDESIGISEKYPFTIPTLMDGEGKILQSATNLFEYLSLLVINYGEISKMKVSDRNLIYEEINDQLDILSAQCNSLRLFMERVQLADELKNSKPLQMINKDQQLVKDILHNIKN